MKTNDQEKALLEGLAANDTNAIETIYRENYSAIKAFIINNNGYSDDARDIFQEAMIVLFENVKSGSFILSCQLQTYLYSVCRRLWLKKLQKQNRFNHSIEPVHEVVAVENEIELYEKRDGDFTMMENALQKIGEPCKSLLEAFYIEKRSMSEIADSFGYTNAENAKTQKYKCLVRLKKLFFSQYNKTD
ncbi:MAG TPA: sigma-70 family RNA polymerase sigma factor [Hanamia sp.]|nr:sigma-70 family RNA polymerase sigma factor [Hanamia sp.]